jgi:hypothetical protein
VGKTLLKKRQLRRLREDEEKIRTVAQTRVAISSRDVGKFNNQPTELPTADTEKL